MQRIFCLMGFHAPKRRYVTKIDDAYHAPCRHCRRALVKGNRFWRASAS